MLLGMLGIYRRYYTLTQSNCISMKASPSSTALAALVCQIADVAKNGGRCTPVDNDRCALYDCSNWTEEMVGKVHREFPMCYITVSSNTASASGFVVFFQLRSTHYRITRTIFLCGCISLCSVIAYYMTVSVQKVLSRDDSGSIPFIPNELKSYVPWKSMEL